MNSYKGKELEFNNKLSVLNLKSRKDNMIKSQKKNITINQNLIKEEPIIIQKPNRSITL